MRPLPLRNLLMLIFIASTSLLLLGLWYQHVSRLKEEHSKAREFSDLRARRMAARMDEYLAQIEKGEDSNNSNIIVPNICILFFSKVMQRSSSLFC